MGIYRGAGGTGDAVADSSSEALLVRNLAVEVQADADAAAASAAAALVSETNAETAATNAQTAETNAETAEANAETAQAAAEAAQSAAETAETNAETAQAAAATSATNAASSASAASTSATATASSASTASTQATNASNSASAAATSATNASNSASAAATSATNAAGSATAAAGSATSASNSASSAASSESNASTSATNAAASASTATTQAGIATTQATNAASSASAASTSATNAASSATAAAGSATSASNSASTATTQATNASNSASAASTSATNAATSATNAAASATLAASYTPSQTGNSGKFLTTNGTSTSWGTAVTSVSATSPVASSGGTTPTISMPAATTSVSGYLTSTDWNTFNGKQASLVSGSNIKTVNGTSLLGSGDVGTISVSYGGTGLTSVTAGYVPYGNGTGALSTSSNLTFSGSNLTVGGAVNAGNGSTGGFYTTTYATNAVNNIWSFGNATTYGIKYFQGTSGTAINGGNADTIAFPFGQTTAGASAFQMLCVGNLGALVMPKQPAFRASLTNSGDQTLTNTYLAFNVETFDKSNSYDTSTATFTAPVAGTYFFYVQTYGTSSAGAATMNNNFRVNGVAISPSNGDIFIGGNAGESKIAPIENSMTINLAAGDQVRVYASAYNSAAVYRIYTGNSIFTGWLIG